MATGEANRVCRPTFTIKWKSLYYHSNRGARDRTATLTEEAQQLWDIQGVPRLRTQVDRLSGGLAKIKPCRLTLYLVETRLPLEVPNSLSES